MGTLPSIISSNTTLTGTTGTPSGGTTLDNVQLVNQGTLTDSTGITGGVGTVTNSNGATFIVADPLTVGAIDNEGTLTLSNGGAQQTTITANLLANEGELQATFPGGGFASNVEIIDAVLVNSGTFAMTSGTGTVKLEAGGASTGSISVAAGAILEFGSTGSVTYTMSGTYGSSGTTEIDLGATVSFTSGTTVDVSTGTAWDLGQPQFNSVEPGGTLDLSQAVVTGSFRNLAMNGVLLLGSNSVTVNGFSIAGEVSDSATLTLNGTVGSGEMLSGILTGGGTVVLQQGAQPSGAITLDGGETLTNEGTLAISTGGLGSDGNSGDTLDNASGATLALSGGSVTIDVARLVNSGTITVAASTLADIAVTTMTGSGGITVAAGGTLEITQGTIVGAIDGLNLQGSLILGSLPVTIDGFSLAGTAFLFDQATVTMGGSNGTLGGILTGGGTVVLSSGQSSTVTSVLALKIRETLENEGSLTVNADINGNTGSETLVNASGATLAFTGGAVSTSLVNVVNDGTIEVSGGTVSITTGTLSGGGAIVVTAGTLDLSQATITGSLGSLTDDGTLSLGANSVTFDGVSMAAGSALSDSATVTLIGGTDGGSLPYSTNAELGGTLSGGGTVVLGSFSQSYGIVTNPFAIGTDETLENDGSLVVATLVVADSGTLNNTSVGTLILTGDNSGSVNLNLNPLSEVENAGLMVVSAGSNATIRGQGQFIDTGTITVSSGATLDLLGATITGSLGNVNDAGTLLLGSAVTINGLSLSGLLLTDRAAVTLTGAAVPDGATGTIEAAVTGSSNLTIGSGSTLSLGATVGSGAAIKFNGANGLLVLDSPAGFGGSISGLADGDTIDLASTAATSVSYADGNLVVSDNGDTVATLALAGTYSSSQFILESDGAGGSDVIYESDGQAPISTNYTGQIVFDVAALPLDGLSFLTEATANVTVTYQTSITSASAHGTWSYTASAIAYPSGSSGSASSGTASGGSITELPPNSGFSNTLSLNILSTTFVDSSGSYWIADDALMLNITGVTATTISGTAIDYVHDNDGSVTELTTSFTLKTSSTAAASSDFNGDGTSDILLAETGTGSLGIDLMSNGAVSSFGNAGTPAAGWSVAGFGDFSGDGTTDILFTNAGTGALGAYLMSNGQVAGWDDLGAPAAGWSLAGIGDITGSGTADILWQNAGTGALGAYLISNGQVTGWDDLGTPTAGWSLVGVGDFTGDGTADILWQNTSTGAVGAYQMSNGQVAGWDDLGSPGTGWSVVGIGDFTGDGTQDILFQNTATTALGIDIISNGQVSAWDSLGTPAAGWSVVGTGDITGSGTADILFQNAGSGAVGAYLMSGGQVTGWDSLGTPGAGWSVVGDNALGLAAQVTSVPAPPLGDINGDGTTDIVWRNSSTGGLGAFLMSNGAAGATADLGTPSAGWTLAGLGDFNGTGTSDILWQNAGTSAVGADVMNGGQVAGWDALGTPAAGWNLVGLGDFTGTGTDDILWQNASTGAVGAYVVSNGQVTGWDDLGTPAAGWTLVGTGDFNGTGTDDILWQNASTGAVGADVVSNGQVTGWDDLGTPAAGWTLVGIGDFNGTGTDDILWQNASTGAVGAYVVSNGQVTGWDDLGTAPAGSSVAGIGDYNGDGTSDILWQNPTTGALAVAIVSNGTVTATSSLTVSATGLTLLSQTLAPSHT